MEVGKVCNLVNGKNEAVAGWLTVLGGLLIHFVIGTMYNWANIVVYVTSYLRVFDSSITYSDTIKVYPISLLVHGCVLIGSGWVAERIGSRNCCLLGTFIFVSGTLLASASTTFMGIILSQGILFGCGMGLLYTTPLASALQLLPHRRGVVSGLIVAGFGCGPFIFGPISMLLVNPDHLEVDSEGPNKGYFSPHSPVVANVPFMFRSLALIYVALLLTGVMLVSDIKESSTSLKTEQRVGDGAYVQVKGCTDDIEYRRQINSDDAPSTVAIEMPSNPLHGPDNLVSGLQCEKDRTKVINQSVRDMNPCQVFQEPLSWHLALCLGATSVGGLYLASAVKVFGQQYFQDEVFLTMVSAVSSLCNSFGRIGWGQISDYFGTWRTLVVSNFILANLIFTFQFSTAHLGKTGFALWSFCIFFCEGANFVVYLPLTVSLFGSRHIAGIYGLLFFIVPVFTFINIFVLAEINISFATASIVLGIVTLCGWLSLLLLRLHISIVRVIEGVL